LSCKLKLEAQWAEPVSLTFHSALRKLCIEPSIGASYQILVHLATRFQRFLKNNPPKNCLWWPCLLTNRDEISIFRGPSIDASYQVLVHLAKRFQRRIFRHRPIRNKNCRWHPCLLTDRDKMSNLYRGPFIDASYQVLVHLAMRLQRRRYLEIDQSETRIACGGHVCQRNRMICAIFIENLP
jgi:hypothetical protein